jgi:hypothetical protein
MFPTNGYMYRPIVSYKQLMFIYCACVIFTPVIYSHAIAESISSFFELAISAPYVNEIILIMYNYFQTIYTYMLHSNYLGGKKHIIVRCNIHQTKLLDCKTFGICSTAVAHIITYASCWSSWYICIYSFCWLMYPGMRR